ncbi:hypothetical protein BU23DRAFT_585902 [Bimuria novae-zelandiae CBS 107.79]|uniref:Rhodopsin domain-containing protein n=1 Tax=Bimuria novae-zelandiae CBS 107.79 TaxID=1447943 RepID=A0A6A5W3M9_9PLEO|nr:hypothetical protein BU23DRAFT_585902 [Bimuria novae-zelandiae CBS 107.79]
MANFISAENHSRQPMFLIITGILLLLFMVAVALRFWCRFVHTRYVGPDDWFMLGALIIAIGMGIQNGFHVSWGTGRHGSDLDLLAILVPTLKHWYAYQLVILALYHRIFTQTKFRRVVYAVTAFVTIYTVVVFFVNAFECPKNPSNAWSSTFPQGCNNLPATYFSTASITLSTPCIPHINLIPTYVVNILTDILILLLPTRAFWTLHLHPHKRLALLGVFLVGAIAVLASIVRLYALYVYTTTKDVAYDAIFTLLLSQIEFNVAIISASAPALCPLFNKTFMSSSYNMSNQYAAGYGSGVGSKVRSRAKEDGRIELYTYDVKKEIGMGTKHMRGGMSAGSNTSEESILRAGGGDGIRKATDVSLVTANDSGVPNSSEHAFMPHCLCIGQKDYCSSH